MKKVFYYGQMKTGLLIVVCILSLQQISSAQIIGNKAFSNNGNNNNYYNRPENRAREEQVNRIYLSDNSFTIQAKVIKNIKADHYIAVFGLSDWAKTVGQANSKINERIKSFIANIEQAGIKENDIYTDIIAQYRI